IPYEQKDENIRVIGLPFITPAEMNNQQMNALKLSDLESMENIQGDEKEKLTAFIQDFLTKYAENNSEDMRYMMKSPEGLKGLVTFKELSDDFEFKKSNGKYLATGTVTFLIAGTTLEQKETVKLTISKTEKNYFIDEMVHFLK
ncbi:MAG: conjugal transfer protein, partial [Streptococcaceae bacterium]|nr:conjugal transfer protein [Streptococcaceae bacterium]